MIPAALAIAPLALALAVTWGATKVSKRAARDVPDVPRTAEDIARRGQE